MSSPDPSEEELLGTGGQGRVYADRADPQRRVRKIYNQPLPPDRAGALRHLIDVQTWARPSDVVLASLHTAWPLALVESATGEARGVVLPRAPQAFVWSVHAAGVVQTRLRELSFLLRPDYFKRQGVRTARPRVTKIQRIHIAVALADVIDVLHRHGLVYGDFSEKNILWSTEPTQPLFLLDCDGILPQELAEQHRVHTPGWRPGEGMRGQAADIQLLGVTIARLLACSDDVTLERSSLSAGLGSGWRRSLFDCLLAAQGPAGQPTAAEVAAVLRQLLTRRLADTALQAARTQRVAAGIHRELRTGLHEDRVLGSAVERQIDAESRVRSLAASGATKAARRALHRLDPQFVPDIPPTLLLRLGGEALGEELQRLALDGRFRECADLITRNPQLLNHPWSTRLLESAILDAPAPRAYVQHKSDGVWLVVQWSDDPMVDCLVADFRRVGDTPASVILSRAQGSRTNRFALPGAAASGLVCRPGLKLGQRLPVALCPVPISVGTPSREVGA